MKSNKASSYWAFTLVSPKVLEFKIFGRIGGPEVNRGALEVAADNMQTIRQELMTLGAGVSDIDIFINSGGGSSVEGFGIHDSLRGHPARKTVHIAGVCASAATLVAMAGDRIIMARNAIFMVHEIQHIVIGGASDLASAARFYEREEKRLRRTYAIRTGLPTRRIRDLMARETVMTATQALELGFIDEIGPVVEAENVLITPTEEIMESKCLRCSYRWHPPKEEK